MKEKINYWSSLKLSIAVFGWRLGIKLPILIYGKIKVYELGKIIVKCPIQKGVLTIGLNQADVPYAYTIINNTGTIELLGKTFINYGTKIRNTGRMIFHGNNIIGHGVSFDIMESFEIGFNSTIGFMSTVTDTNVHYTIDVSNRKVYRKTAPIKIGAYNWIGSYTHIKKGAVTPDYTIVSSPNAMLGKDYSSIEPYSILAGCPAKVLRAGLRRLYNFQTERELNEYFAKNPNSSSYSIPGDLNLDEYCKMNL